MIMTRVKICEDDKKVRQKNTARLIRPDKGRTKIAKKANWTLVLQLATV